MLKGSIHQNDITTLNMHIPGTKVVIGTIPGWPSLAPPFLCTPPDNSILQTVGRNCNNIRISLVELGYHMAKMKDLADIIKVPKSTFFFKLVKKEYFLCGSNLVRKTLLRAVTGLFLEKEIHPIALEEVWCHTAKGSLEVLQEGTVEVSRNWE